ncbi:FAD-dependent oxidoreductase [Pseudooceanicola nanhaiensis]|uniref:FAD-dependent oxidoreductase n=1 Tax=Pseudooceanicola nanhaiensis TaxID=375761 RepID=UPI001CD36F22|nr:FAD-dependent oxidoreductase [Pseudooceanicola nanhaiensis]MCA0921188.1 FAD-dependent oxidoreductase [Pseudooceanicola nanhaiensis]
MKSETDIVVLGSGAAGLCAAVTAAHLGARVVLLEKADVLGGTTAWSGGWIFAPRNPVAVRAGINEPEEAPREYLKAVLGNHYEPERVEAFLKAAPEMVGFLEENTAVAWEGGLKIPDTYSHQPGAGMGGRSVIAAPYDARGLGKAVSLLREPVRETTFHGMTIQAGPDLRAFMTMTRSFPAFVHATKRVLRHMRDLAFHRRGMDLRNGTALIGRLVRSALDKDVEIRTGVAVRELLVEEGRVTGVLLPDGTELRATRGVVLACGGFPQDMGRRAGLMPRNDEHRTLAVETATGDGLRLAEGAGGVVRTDQARPAAFCPVSTVRWPDGRVAQFPHIIDRGKPGVIGVLADGKRFCNEGLGYHDYVEALLKAVPEGTPARSWMVCDHRFLRRFGLGVVRPQPAPWRQWVGRGYLKTDTTIEGLAAQCGIDPKGLLETISDWNAGAVKGEDPAFHRGTTAYMRLQGDPDQAPNPNVAPILKPPFHAVEVVPGSFGTFSGISTDAKARVLQADGTPVPGLYAAGTDAASVFGGFYPAGGIAIGPALTFGYIAGRDAAQKET